MGTIHRRVADQVFERLRQQIVSGSLAPGDRVDSTEIAESLGVSRTPVREAILRLDAQGLVERQPYRGVVVSGIDHLAAEDVAALRIHLETLAARVAVPRLGPADLAELRRLHEELQLAVNSEDPQEAFGVLNRQFHLVVYRAAQSPALVQMIEDLAAQAQRIRLHFDVRQGPAVADHEQILAACEAGDVERVVAATRDHILGAHLLMMPAGYQIAAGSRLAVVLGLFENQPETSKIVAG